MPVSTTSARISVVVPDAHSLTYQQLQSIFTGAKAANIGHATVHVRWNLVQPANSAGGDMAASGLATAIQAAGQAGVRLGLVLTGPRPTWATRGNASEFTNFVATVANWSRDQARAWGFPPATEFTLWHWPNASVSWGAAPDPVEYTDILKASYPLVKAANPANTVIFGNLAPVTTVRATQRVASRRGRGSRGNAAPTLPAERSPQDFLNACYLAGAKGYFDVLGYTPVSIATPQQAKPPAPSNDAIKQSDDLRAIMSAKGDAAKKMHWTVGYDTAVFTEIQQRLYLDTLRSFAEVRKDHVTGLNLYTYRDLA